MTKSIDEKAQQPTTIPFTGIRKTTAKLLAKSHSETPHVTLIREFDATSLKKFREKLLEREREIRVSYTGIIVKACAEALKAYPVMHSRLEVDQIRLLEQINIGVAVALESGLIVPIIRNADQKSLKEICVELINVVSKAHKGELTLREVTGGTFTITNLGMYHVDAFTPIINPPQSAILGVGRIVEKPLAISGKVEIRSTMIFSLTHDHRIMDGAVAAQFLDNLIQILEKPEKTSYFTAS